MFQDSLFSVLAPKGRRVACAYRPGHIGTALDIRDPRAWHGSIAVGNNPTQAAVDAHLSQLTERGHGAFTSTPVAWDFGKVFWERSETLCEVPQ